jgi:hypothetical protein
LDSCWTLLKGYRKATGKCRWEILKGYKKAAELPSSYWQKRGNFRFISSEALHFCLYKQKIKDT